MLCFVVPDREPDIHKDSCFPQELVLLPGSWTQGRGNRPRAHGDSFSKCRCPAGEGQLEMWRPCANQCVGPSGPGAYFHYQGHIPEILWGPGTYYRRIKTPKENTHLRARPGFFIFKIGRWVCPSWGCRRKGAAGQSVSMGVQSPMGEAGRHPARAAGPPTRPSGGHAGHPLPLT